MTGITETASCGNEQGIGSAHKERTTAATAVGRILDGIFSFFTNQNLKYFTWCN